MNTRRSMAMLLLSLLASFAATARGGVFVQAKAKVFVTDLSDSSGKLDPQRDRLVSFISTLMALKVSELKSFEVESARVPPSCSSSGEIDSSKGVHIDNRTNQADSYYLTTGTLQSGSLSPVSGRGPRRDGGASDLLVTLEVYKVTRCHRVELYHTSEPINVSNALQTLNTMVDLVALELADSNAVKVKVANVEYDGSQSENQQIAEDLHSYLVEAINQSDEYLVKEEEGPAADQPVDYMLKTRLKVNRRRSLTLQSEVASASLDFQVYRENQIVWETRVEKRFDDYKLKQSKTPLSIFYADASGAGLEALARARSAAALAIRRPDDIGSKSDAELEAKATAFQCEETTSGRPCDVDRQAALLVLSELVRRHPEKDEMRTRLASLQLELGDYPAAAASYEQILTSASDKPPDTLFALQKGAGDAWYGSQQYDKAAARLREAINTLGTSRLSPAPDLLWDELAVRLELSHALRLNDDQVAAFQVLVDGLGRDLAPGGLNIEMRDQLESMKYAELQKVEAALRDCRRCERLDPNVPFALHLQAAKSILNTDPEAADGEMKLAESVQTDAVDLSLRAQLALMRGNWYSDRRQWTTAEPYFNNALRYSDDPITRHSVAVFYYNWASVLDSSAPQRVTLFHQAAATAKPLLENDVESRSEGPNRYAEAIYRNANHETKEDALTRQVYGTILKEHPRNLNVLVGLMGVCTDNLHDLDCAFRASERAKEFPQAAADTGVMLDVVEIFVQSGHYREALDALRGVPDPASQDYRAVASFYDLWASSATGAGGQADAARRRWNANMQEFRKRILKSEPFNWRFDGARAVLERDHQMAPRLRESLRKMIEAMEDEKVPLPQVEL